MTPQVQARGPRSYRPDGPYAHAPATRPGLQRSGQGWACQSRVTAWPACLCSGVSSNGVCSIASLYQEKVHGRNHPHARASQTVKSRTTPCHKDPVERRPVHVEQRGDDSHGLALGAKVPGMGNLLRRQLRLGANFTPRCLAVMYVSVAGQSGYAPARPRRQSFATWAAGGGLGVDVLGQLKFDPLGAARPAA